MSQLQVLDLQQNKLQAVPVELSHLSQLLVLNLNCNRVSKLPSGKPERH
jgi:Leucine-rich repeat (LRR) protein